MRDLLDRPDVRLHAPGWDHRACISANLVNNLAIGPPTYMLATEFFVYKSNLLGGYSLIRSLTSALGLVLTHALGYHYAHSQMHRPQMYWAHKFHHAFAKHVTPSSANAVSVVEYAYAYMLPFVVGCAVCAPDERALLMAVAVISVNNLLIHTPALEVTCLCFDSFPMMTKLFEEKNLMTSV